MKHLAPWEIVLDDLATVPLEVAALDRGYHRPERPGFALDARIVSGRAPRDMKRQKMLLRRMRARRLRRLLAIGNQSRRVVCR